MIRRFLGATAAVLILSGCGGGSDPELDQTGPRPDQPERNETLDPPMNISTPT